MGNVLADSDTRASATMAEAEPHPHPPAKRARLAPAPAPRPDRILVPQEQEQQEQQQQPGQAHEGFRVTAAEFDGLQTLVEMAEHEPGAVRFSVNVSESDLRGAIELLRDGTGFAVGTAPGALARAVAAWRRSGLRAASAERGSGCGGNEGSGVRGEGSCRQSGGG